MQSIHALVVGAGSFGRHHVRHLSQHPAIASLTVVDRDARAARALAEQHGAAFATSTEGVTADIAVVAVPTEAHRAVAEPLLKRGVSCFVEKPIAGTDADAAALVALAAERGVILQTGHIERHGTVFGALAKAAGDVRYVAARRLNPPRPVPPTADVVLDLMIHDIDLALSLIAAPVTSVESFACGPVGADSVVARIGFANGAIADLTASRQSPVTERTLVVHDTAAVWRADLVAGTLDRCAGREAGPAALPEPHDNLRAELDDFLSAVRTGRRPLVCGEAGAAALAVANRIRAAAFPAALSA